MSRKYISNQKEENFVYPNNTIDIYDLELIHNINGNMPYGTVSNFTGTSLTYTGITISFNYTYNLNSGEYFYLQDDTTVSQFSVHMIEPSGTYFKPFRCVYNQTGTTSSGSVSFSVTPSQMGVSSFTNGTYYFEIRFIGAKSVYPVNASLVVSTIVGPTPTPTPTPSITPTMTPTPSSTPSGATFKSGATLNVTDPGWIKYDTNVANDVYEFVSSTGTHTITACTNCNTITPGFPFADVASFTITNCGSDCGGVTPVTPTPTPTNTTYYYYRLTRCDNFQTYWSQSYPSGTFSSGDRVEGGTGVFYVVSGSQTSNPGGTLYTVTRVPGATGCP